MKFELSRSLNNSGVDGIHMNCSGTDEDFRHQNAEESVEISENLKSQDSLITICKFVFEHYDSTYRTNQQLDFEHKSNLREFK
jgi:hypothetical protein